MLNKLILSVFLLVLTGIFPAVVQADKVLLASVYPGSLMIKQEQTKKPCYFSEGNRGEAFYTKDDIEQVLSFYKERLGVPGELKPDSGWGDDGRKYHWEIKWHFADFGGVLISTPRLREYEDTPGADQMPPGMEWGQQACYSHELFKPLFGMISRIPDKCNEDFLEVCSRYLHLTWSLFPPSEHPDKQGKFLSMDKFLLSQNQQDHHPPSQAELEAMYARMVEFSMAGKSVEAAELAQLMMGGGLSNDWDGYVGLLEEIEKFAFQTRIAISYDPATWPEWQ